MGSCHHVRSAARPMVHALAPALTLAAEALPRQDLTPLASLELQDPQ